jgi:hypothetical protein
MKWTFRTLVRTSLWAAIGLVAVAIGLGHSSTTSTTAPVNHPADARFHGVNLRCASEGDLQPCFLDRQTGQLLRVETPPGETLDYAVCSPWRDERGQYQAVCRWMTRLGNRSDSLPHGFGLARLSLPEGKVLERVQIEQIPTGEPSWVPGAGPSVVFPSGDGEIYRFDFHDARNPPAGDREFAQPERVPWRLAPPGTGLVFIRDLIWPAEERLGGRLIAALSYLEEGSEKSTMSGTELWWLRLSPDQTAIEAAGRLAAPDSEDRPGPEDADVEERLPYVARKAGGDLALVYLRRPSGQPHWELRVASLVIDPATGNPMVRPGSGHDAAGRFVCSSPTFSADGRWVYGVRGDEHGSPQLTLCRFSAATALLAQSRAIPTGPLPARVEPGPLFGWADLAPFSTSRLVEAAKWRHAGTGK